MSELLDDFLASPSVISHLTAGLDGSTALQQRRNRRLQESIEGKNQHGIDQSVGEIVVILWHVECVCMAVVD